MNLYRRWMETWERNLTLRDPHRRIHSFDWGLEWLTGNGNGAASPLAFLKQHSRQALDGSREYFKPVRGNGFRLEDDQLSFPSPLPGPLDCNNTAQCRLFRAPGATSAVIVIPQWNADRNSHVGICKFLRRLGITAARLCLPFHEGRKPAGQKRADFMVGPNLGRTLAAVRQAVLEVRLVLDWLKEQGYQQVGVLGTSVGSCVGYLAFVHEPGLQVGVFNHVSSLFADVVWEGLSTRYIRWGLDGYIKLDDLRECWAPISPLNHVQKLHAAPRPHLLITAKYDLTFPPGLAQLVFQEYERLGISADRAQLPCGHYSTARFPFKYLDGWHMIRYLLRHLPR